MFHQAPAPPLPTVATSPRTLDDANKQLIKSDAALKPATLPVRLEEDNASLPSTEKEKESTLAAKGGEGKHGSVADTTGGDEARCEAVSHGVLSSGDRIPTGGEENTPAGRPTTRVDAEEGSGEKSHGERKQLAKDLSETDLAVRTEAASRIQVCIPGHGCPVQYIVLFCVHT